MCSERPLRLHVLRLTRLFHGSRHTTGVKIISSIAADLTCFFITTSNKIHQNLPNNLRESTNISETSQKSQKISKISNNLKNLKKTQKFSKNLKKLINLKNLKKISKNSKTLQFFEKVKKSQTKSQTKSKNLFFAKT